MPVEIEDFASDIAVMDGDLPLSERQLEKLARLVMAHMEKEQRMERQFREATTVRRRAAPPVEIGE